MVVGQTTQKPIRGPLALAIASVLAAIVYAGAWSLLRTPAATEQDYFDYRGTAGPFAVVATKEGLVTGNAISTIKRGQQFAWKSNICFHSRIPVLSETELVHLPDEHEVNRIEVPLLLEPEFTRCGVRVVFRGVPIDAAPGYYEVRRQLLFQPPNRAPISAVLPPLHIEVLP